MEIINIFKQSIAKIFDSTTVFVSSLVHLKSGLIIGVTYDFCAAAVENFCNTLFKYDQGRINVLDMTNNVGIYFSMHDTFLK